jgi:DNA invertase Pin-like site-specific DNA recombinase
MRTALYARVSTTDKGQHVGMQVSEFQEFCTRRNWTIADQYIDAGISGSKERRPQLDRLMADARKRKFDAVLVYRFDRFARSMRQLVNALAEFQSLGIEFISLHEGIDTSTPNGRLVFGIMDSDGHVSMLMRPGSPACADRTAHGLRLARRPVYQLAPSDEPFALPKTPRKRSR